MAVGPFTDALILYGPYDLSADHNQIQVDSKVDMLEDTVFGDTTHSFAPGLLSTEVSGSGFVQFSETATPNDVGANLFAEIGAAQKNLTFANSNADGAIAHVAKGVSDTFSWSLNPAELGSFDWQVKGNQQLGQGHVLLYMVNRTVTTNGSIYQTGALAATESMVCNLHVKDFNGTSLDVVVYSNDTNDTVTPTARATFTQATGITSEQIVVSGAITDTYWYAVATFVGTSFDAAVSIGIIDNA